MALIIRSENSSNNSLQQGKLQHAKKPKNVDEELKLTNPFLKTYLQYVENTESPTLMHIWSAISCAAACLGRHAWLDTGIGKLYANQFVLLVGPPGTRKSKALSFSSKLVRDFTGTRFAPDDTGGQRQGLITSMSGVYTRKEEDDFLNDAMMIDIENAFLQKPTGMDKSLEDLHTLYATASEFGTMMGQTNLEFARFLIKVWDGESYEYQLKNELVSIPDGLLNILGGTTPKDLAAVLPQEAIGQGLLSRFILVYSPSKRKSVPRPTLKRNLEEKIAKVYNNLYMNMHGAFTETPEAYAYSDQLYLQYDKHPRFADTRFTYYSERRQSHLAKLAMCLAAVRFSFKIELQDIQEAEHILRLTEETMPDALGEFGLSKLSDAKQKLLEFLNSAKSPITKDLLYAAIQKQVTHVEYHTILQELLQTGSIIEMQVEGREVIMAKAFDDDIIKSLINVTKPITATQTN